MTTATAPLDRLLRARQARLRCAEQARKAELSATRYADGSPLHREWTSIAAGYRTTAADWAVTITELEAADPGRVAVPCCHPGCCKRGTAANPFCPEHD